MQLYHYLGFSLFAKDLIKYKINKKAKPLILVWSLTNRCNLSCKYCGLPDLDHSGELRGDRLLNYLNNAIDAGVRIISITGGEPLLHPDCENFLKITKSRNVLVSLNSNGILVEKNIKLLKKYCYEVVVSWDGLEKWHDQARGNGSFNKALEAISILKKAGIRCHATCVFTQHTARKLGEILEVAKKHEFKVSFQPVWSKTLTYQSHQFAMPEMELLSAISFMIEVKKKGNDTLYNSLISLQYWESLIRTPQIVKCKAGLVFARVEPDGNLKKCGRVEEEISYEKVLKNGIQKSFTDLLSFDECSSCHSWAGINTNTFF